MFPMTLMECTNTLSTVLSWNGSQNKKMADTGRQPCGKNQNLNGFHRVSKCHGSLQCTKEKCPKVQCNLGQNKSSFERFAGEYTCKICGHLVERIWCGAKKAIEYDRMTHTLTVWHQGYHNCILKQPRDCREQKEQKRMCSK